MISGRQGFGRLRVTAVLVLAITFCGAAGLVSGGDETAAEPTAGSSPFEVGEKLVYQVEWNPPWYLFFLPAMEAGEADLTLAGDVEYPDGKALKIVFSARSSGTLAKLAGLTIDDRYEFFTDPETFCTRYVSKRIREGKRRHDINVAYLPGSRRLHIRDLDVSVVPPRINKDEFVDDIPPCVKDLFSALYSVRRGTIEAGTNTRLLVGDNDKIKEIEVRVEKRETVDTPQGKYDSWRINTVAVLGGLFKSGGQFRIWLSADSRKIPVKFEAKVSLGKVTGKLKDIRVEAAEVNRSRP